MGEALTLWDNVSKALEMATEAHAGQKRKYSGEDYIVHPKAVAKLVAEYAPDLDMVRAALLHDTLEDTDLSPWTICNAFGDRVLQLVRELTDISTPQMGNRATRKRIDRHWTAKGSVDAHTIKLADMIDNTKDIAQNDLDFAIVYLAEMQLLLPLLRDGNPSLYAIAEQVLMEAQEKVNDYVESKKAGAIIPETHDR